MTNQPPMRAFAASLIAGLSLVLTGCFITPGKFESELILTDESAFSFTYEGEIFFLGMSQLAQMGGEAEFEARCYDEDTGEDRECTQIEIDDQRANWENEREMRKAEAQQKSEQMAMIMGEIDPSDPEAVEALRQMLLRQRGWERVEDKGEGVFDITYRIQGTLGHDFMFPVIEGMPTANPFVQIFVRDDNIVRINAPGFAPQNEMAPMMGGLGGMFTAMGAEESASEGTSPMEKMPVPEGTFRIVTNRDIRANNTDEGPNPSPQGQLLEWDISPRTTSAPTALIDLSN